MCEYIGKNIIYIIRGIVERGIIYREDVSGRCVANHF